MFFEVSVETTKVVKADLVEDVLDSAAVKNAHHAVQCSYDVAISDRWQTISSLEISAHCCRRGS